MAGQDSDPLSRKVAALTRQVAAMDRRLAALERAAGTAAAIDPDRLYRISEAAVHLACSRSNAHVLVRDGKLPATRTGVAGRGTRILGADLVAFLDSRRSAGPGGES